MKWYFITSLELFHHFVEWNDIISSRVLSFISWQVTRRSRVTSHEMKRKTSEEMMSFHSSKWWNNERRVIEISFHFAKNVSNFISKIYILARQYTSVFHDSWIFTKKYSTHIVRVLIWIFWWFQHSFFGTSKGL